MAKIEIVECVKFVIENNMYGCDYYVDMGDTVTIQLKNGDTIRGELIDVEYDYENPCNDKIFLYVEDDTFELLVSDIENL